ncbi:hypothetical protein B0H16DRAFT_1224346, partial [Mycena metata]
MVGCALMYDISVALCAAKGDPNVAFGGVNMIFAGDFYQLPPVGQIRLYAHIDKYTKDKKKRSGIHTLTASTPLGQKNIAGKLLWLSVNKVVLLHEPMRQTGPENEAFVSLLGRFVDWTQQPWNLSPIVVNENEMKDQLNFRAVMEFAKQTGRELHWYYCED